MTISDYLLSCAYNFKPKVRLTKEEAAQELADTFGYIAKFLEPVDHERNLIEHCHALLCGYIELL